MCIIFALIEKVAKSRVLSVSCSLIWGMILYFFGFMLSLDKDGVNNLGFVGIFGMFFMFSAVAATVLYIVFRQLTKSKASYVEITTVAVLIGLTFIIGCVMTSL
jgi:EamA domain-containing membrane protein RarD